ncbi:hypothetical protein BZG36_05308 [Bifiguratus adelaidae]|uniref:Uncharacterized protein n=1 Tax=Bifiguratus adelaidae TaxID=1938954 RepID=A0A261XTU0_9FUNG|nr:hypothetical protein BZG36_05308 [Bifiguratus adelaidae]
MDTFPECEAVQKSYDETAKVEKALASTELEASEEDALLVNREEKKSKTPMFSEANIFYYLSEARWPVD